MNNIFICRSAAYAEHEKNVYLIIWLHLTHFWAFSKIVENRHFWNIVFLVQK